MGRKPADVSEAELEILKVLWAQGPASVREAIDRLGEGKPRAYTTVLTLFQRLAAKGCVAAEARGGANVYRAIVSRESLLQSRLGELVEQLCDGARSPLLHALMAGGKWTADDVLHFRRLLEKIEDGGESKPDR